MKSLVLLLSLMASSVLADTVCFDYPGEGGVFIRSCDISRPLSDADRLKAKTIHDELMISIYENGLYDNFGKKMGYRELKKCDFFLEYCEIYAEVGYDSGQMVVFYAKYLDSLAPGSLYRFRIKEMRRFYYAN